MLQGDVPGLHAVEKHEAQQNCAWDYMPVRFWKLRAARALKMPAILRYDSPSSHARSWAHLCSWSPREQDPGTSPQPFLSAQEVGAGVANQGACLKPHSPWGPLFQSLEQQVFSPVRADPHRTCSRGGSFTSSPRQGPGCTSYPRCLFSQAQLSVRPKNCSYKCDSPAYGQWGRCFQT